MKPIKIIQTSDCCSLFKIVWNKMFHQPLLFNTALNMPLWMSKKIMRDCNWLIHISFWSMLILLVCNTRMEA